MTTIYRYCDVSLLYTVTGIPTGLSVTKAIWMAKISRGDADADAALTVTVTDVTVSSNTATVRVPITDAEAGGLSPRTYRAALKLILSNGDAVAVDADDILQVRDLGVVAVS